MHSFSIQILIQSKNNADNSGFKNCWDRGPLKMTASKKGFLRPNPNRINDNKFSLLHAKEFTENRSTEADPASTVRKRWEYKAIGVLWKQFSLQRHSVHKWFGAAFSPSMRSTTSHPKNTAHSEVSAKLNSANACQP